MSRLWPPQVVHQPPMVTTLRTVMVQRVPRVTEIGKLVVLVIRPARCLAHAAKKLALFARVLVCQVPARPLLSPLLTDRPPPTDGATA